VPCREATVALPPALSQVCRCALAPEKVCKEADVPEERFIDKEKCE
jgi:hypothetical protein